MHKNATKCNKTLSKWCKNKHGASNIIDMLETYQCHSIKTASTPRGTPLPPYPLLSLSLSSLHHSSPTEVAVVLKLALALASRRGHAQVTPLHIAFALLAPSCLLQQQQQQPAEEALILPARALGHAWRRLTREAQGRRRGGWARSWAWSISALLLSWTCTPEARRLEAGMKHAGRWLGGLRRGGAVSWTPAPRGHEGAAWWLSLLPARARGPAWRRLTREAQGRRGGWERGNGDSFCCRLLLSSLAHLLAGRSPNREMEAAARRGRWPGGAPEGECGRRHWLRSRRGSLSSSRSYRRHLGEAQKLCLLSLILIFPCLQIAC
jgi:hypothetical protein